ncbi:hypothetical protein V501_01465 [Pseudogymnoascus sp. VKM F-4519 (FW-2642)]|nr:hypothetical protein V501_01465 [Pseudogymnoascus sp. VKM F-4519 (FW-2642)]
MDTHVIVADLLRMKGQKPSIRFEDVQLCSVLHNHDDHPVIGFYKLRNRSVKARNDHNSVFHEKHCKAMSKSFHTATILSQLLNGRLQITTRQEEAEISTERNIPSMIVGDTVIIADETFSNPQEVGAHSWNMMLSMNFLFPKAQIDWKYGLTSTSTQYMQISCPNLKSDDSLFTKMGTLIYDNMEIVSGMCLFNGTILKTSISEEEGGVDPDKITHIKPTINETDYIARSSSAIADIASILTARIREQNSTQLVRIKLDIPSFQYYHWVVDKFEKHLCTGIEALKWMEAVDIWHGQIAKVFTNSVQHQLRRRGVSPDSYEINIPSRITSFALSIREALQDQKCPSLQTVLEILDSEKDGLWRAFYQFVPVKEKPQDWEDLSYLFYVFEVIKSALVESNTGYQAASRLDRTSDTQPPLKDQLVVKSAKKRNSKVQSNSRRLIINIDDSAERRIYSWSQEMLMKIRQSHCNMSNSTLVEVYLCRRVFVNGNKTRNRLYHQDPMPIAPMLSRLSEHGGDGGQLMKPFDMVRQLYGSDCAQNLELLFSQVGL